MAKKHIKNTWKYCIYAHILPVLFLGGAFGAKVTFGTPVASPGPQRHHEAVVEDLRSGFKAPVADPVRNGREPNHPYKWPKNEWVTGVCNFPLQVALIFPGYKGPTLVPNGSSSTGATKKRNPGFSNFP